MTRRCCSNCDYWFQTNPIQVGGQCRRYAPRYWDKDHSAIPQTVRDYWCGDFAERQPREDDGPPDIAIEDLEFSVRVHNALMTGLVAYSNGECSTLRSLAQKNKRELLRIPDFGRKGLKEVEEVLKGHGFTLAE